MGLLVPFFFIPLLFVMKIKLSLKIKLFNSTMLRCNNHFSSFLTLLLKCYYLPRHGFAILWQNVELETIFGKML